MIDKLVFNPEDHTYTYGESSVPSVTNLIKLMTDNPYAKVPKRILDKAARYGDKVHSIIENYSLGNEVGDVGGYEGIALRRYQTLEKQNDIIITSCEQKILYLEDDMPLYAGMYDMLGSIKGKISLIDIKTTAELHTNLLKMQLPMYKAALEQMNNQLHIDKLYCLWLPKKNLGRLIEIECSPFDGMLPNIRSAYTKFFGVTDAPCEGQ